MYCKDQGSWLLKKMPLEGIFIEPTSTASPSHPDLSLHISPPSTSKSSSFICNSNNSTQPITCFNQNHQGQTQISSDFSSRTFPVAHTELSLGRNFSGGGAQEPPQNKHVHLQHPNGATTTTAPGSTHLNHISYGVSLLDVSSDGLRPIKGIPVYHNRSFPFLSMDRTIRDKQQKMYSYHHMPSYPSLSSSCNSSSSLCSPSSPYTVAAAAGLDPVSILNPVGNGSPAANYRAGNTGRLNGVTGDGFKSHQLHHHSHQYGHEAPSGWMRSRFLPKLPTKRSIRAPRMRWTSTLHARFVHAVELLGGHESKDFFL